MHLRGRDVGGAGTLESGNQTGVYEYVEGLCRVCGYVGMWVCGCLELGRKAERQERSSDGRDSKGNVVVVEIVIELSENCLFRVACFETP